MAIPSFSESTNFDKPSWSSFAPLPLAASQASHIQDLMCLSSDTGRGMVRLHRKLRHDDDSTLDVASCSFLRIETTAVGIVCAGVSLTVTTRTSTKKTKKSAHFDPQKLPGLCLGKFFGIFVLCFVGFLVLFYKAF